MNLWEIMTDIQFSNPDFTEPCYFCGGVRLSCIASAVNVDESMTEFGLDEGVSFFIRVRASEIMRVLGRFPLEGDPVSFRGRDWRVSRVEEDSSGTGVKVYIRGRSGA